jgi:hypothetical protein
VFTECKKEMNRLTVNARHEIIASQAQAVQVKQIQSNSLI